jgi:hypothetical protein
MTRDADYGSRATCKLVSYVVPDGPPYYANGTTHAVTKCETHDWTFDGTAQLKCPIGRIEEAAEKAIAKIRATAE